MARSLDPAGKTLSDIGVAGSGAFAGGLLLKQDRLAAPVPNEFDTEPPAGEYWVRTVVGLTTTKMIGASRVTTPEEAAAATMYLYRSAVERFDGLVTDVDGKPLGVVGDFKGSAASSPVYPSTLLAEAVRIKGAAHIWFSHNHPSGRPELSSADMTLFRSLAACFDGCGIEARGLLAVADGRAHYTADGIAQSAVDAPAGLEPMAVPVVERMPLPSNGVGHSGVISDPAKALRVASVFYREAGSPGLLLLNAAHSVVAWIPLAESLFADRLRGTGGLNALYRAVSESNASSSILVHGGELDKRIKGVPAWQNLVNGLADIDAAVFDVVDVKRLESMAEQTEIIKTGPAFRAADGPASVAEGAGMTVDRVLDIANQLSSAWANPPLVRVVPGPRSMGVPGIVRDRLRVLSSRGAAGTPEGVYWNGVVYLFAAALKDEAHVERVLAHEALGHMGLRGAFGDALLPILDDLWELRPDLVRERADAYGLDVHVLEQRRQAADEALARLAESRPDLGIVRRTIVVIRSWLRTVKPSLRMSDDEVVSRWIKPARDWIERGRRATSASRVASALVGSPAYSLEGRALPDASTALAPARSGRRSPLGFYSALAEGIDGIQTKASPAAGWKDAIKGLVNKGLAKADEVEWSGVNDWLDLQQGKVSKEQVADYLRQGGVRVEETVLGAPDYSDVEAWWNDEGGANEETPFYDLSPQEQAEAAERYADEVGRYQEGDRQTSKYSQYTFPGGENYREVLLTLPGGKEIGSYAQWLAKRMNITPLEAEDTAEYEDDALHAQFMAEESRAKNSYHSRHWDQPNVLAHIRLNDRTDAEGNCVLFVEEIQSDWAQAGRKQGFGDTPAAPFVARFKTATVVPKQEEREHTDPRGNFKKRFVDVGYTVMYDGREVQTTYDREDAEKAAIYLNEKRELASNTEGWLNLALKRVITMAAEGGYAKVAFINGEQSAARYDLSMQVDHILYRNNGDGTLDVFVNPKHGEQLAFQDQPSAEIERHLGKKLTRRLLDGEGTQDKDGLCRLSGLDLKVCGQGMIAFYDQVVPAAVKKLIGKMGGRMEAVIIGSETENLTDPDTGEEYPTGGKEVAYGQPGFAITPEMRAAVSQGLPLFSLAGRGSAPANDATTHIEITEQPSAEPLAFDGGGRWTNDRGAMPGEPFAYLDGDQETAVAAMREIQVAGQGCFYEVNAVDGQVLSRASTAGEAARLAEQTLDRPDHTSGVGRGA